MLDIILIVAAGGVYYNLAKEFDKKNTLLYGILGAVIVYAGIFLGAIILGLVLEINAPGTINSMSPLLLTLMCVPFGILATWIGYRLLKKSFKKSTEDFNDDNLVDNEFDEFK